MGIEMTNPLLVGDTLPDDLLIGHIAWYMVTKPRLTHKEIEKLVNDCGLSPSIIPKPPRLGDAFKRACRYSERKGLPVPYSDNKVNIMIRDVDTTLEDIERHMVAEIVDPQGRKLDYHDAIRMRFDRTDGVLHASKLKLPAEFETLVDEAFTAFSKEFNEATKFIDAQVIRRMIRQQLDLMRAVSVRKRGSVYFAPIGAKKETEGLEEFLNGLNAGSEFVAIPLPNTKKYQGLVRNAFDEELHADSQRMIEQLTDQITKGRKVSAKTWGEMRQRLKFLQDRSTEYAELVNFEVLKGETELDAVEQKLGKLLEMGLVKT